MSETNKDFFEEENDFEEQARILEEEREIENKTRKEIIRACILFVAILLIIFISYIIFYLYFEYGGNKPDNSNKMCKYVNIKSDKENGPIINESKDKGSCKPFYNVDYFQNQKILFNIDLYGDKTKLFNPINQLDENGICYLNCDSDNDGWPDYNIDLNGDGKADINIIFDYSSKKTCDLNCDINHDMIPDTNIDTDGDGKADINVSDQDENKPNYNIDYKGNRKPIFNVIDESGNITNPINQLDENGKCFRNCDIDNDGWPDYNIVLNPNDNIILNELISTDEESKVNINTGKDIDYKCRIDNSCQSDIIASKNTYINIDVDGDGTPDVNISNDGGNVITNPINNEVLIDGEKVILNKDVDGDGFPDENIDIDGDGIPDLNITNDTGKCVKNCDYNLDGKPDDNISIKDQIISFKDVGIDVDYDGVCDVNCDTNYDGIPDINIDLDGDRVPDLNIDYDKDGVADYNIDTNNDGIPDINIDAYGLGTCNFNCNNGNTNIVSSGNNCTVNCDTNNDGLPDQNVDIDGDGICDFNCDNGSSNIDKDNNYYLDSEYSDEKNMLKIESGDEADVYIYNPLEIVSYDIEPGWDDTYVVKITNNTNYAVSYRILWRNIYNDFTTTNNLDYYVTKSNTRYLDNMKAPYKDVILKDNLLIKDNSTIKYTLNISFKETNVNQNIDSGKRFKGQFYIEIIK